jgi:hypothetical protein
MKPRLRSGITRCSLSCQTGATSAREILTQRPKIQNIGEYAY